MAPRPTFCAPVAVALLLLTGAPHALGADLGRLFFTPQQRDELDRKRDSSASEAEIVVESLLTVNGHVSRSSGKTTTWVNGTPQYDVYHGRDPARVAVEDATVTTAVRIGETLDRTRGEIRPMVEPGAIEIIRGPPEAHVRAR